MADILKFERPEAPKVQDPWAELADEYTRSLRIYVACGFSIIAGLAWGVVLALGKMK